MIETFAIIAGPVMAVIGYLELRVGKKVSKDTCKAHVEDNNRHLERIEARQMMLENHLMGKAMSRKEVEEFIEKNNH